MTAVVTKRWSVVSCGHVFIVRDHTGEAEEPEVARCIRRMLERIKDEDCEE